MASAHQSIALLPLEAQAQIRSSVQITSLSDVILELVKNSLDANASRIEIRLDFLKGYCAVLDDGDGISKSEFLESGGLAQLYHTSKASSQQHSYGRYGRFLASLSAVSLLCITSCHLSDTSVNSKTLKDGQHVVTNLDISDEEISGYSHGTKIIVHNLFGRMPVRVKHRISQLSSQHGREREFCSLRHSLVGLILAASKPFSLDVRNDPCRYLYKPHQLSKQGLLSTTCQLERVVSILFQADLLDSTSTNNWQQACAQSSTLSVQAFLCLDPAPSKSVQYISLNQQPLLSTRYKTLFDQVNRLFDSSTFGVAEEGGEDEPTKHRVSPLRPSTGSFAGGRKEIDRWPIFYISVSLHGVTHPVDESMGPEADKILTLISGSLCALVTEFLKTHGFRSRISIGASEKQRGSPASIHIPQGISNFDNWSRIKSGNSTPSDLLDGLPFFSQKQQEVRPTNLTESLQDETTRQQCVNEGDSVQWRHPRTGNLLSIDARTGMVIPLNSHKLDSAEVETPRIKHCRKISDVMDSLRDYLPCVRVEQTIKSIVPDYDSAMSGAPRWAIDGNTCILEDSGRLCSCGPISVEPAGSSISKLGLKTANVLGQVDRKFVLASVVSDDGHQTTLFLVDQHAADERIRVEDLFQQLCSDESVPLLTPITFEVNSQELKHFQRLHSYFARWQIRYAVLPGQIRVSALPESISERCRLEPKLLIGLLRKGVFQDHSISIRGANANHWLDMISGCPQGIIDILASRACRTAIMFNDELTLEQCRELVRRLATCLFPFQCAHGRPSLTVVARYRGVDVPNGMEAKESSFGVGWQAWNN